ncbi:MAG: PAAR domain-containing protein [Zoogloea sp.]|nr:PAAR domain-containing protein [Zoogloea sp.]
MPSAARVTDLSNHGGTLTGPGEATVLIGGMPAAVVGDMHACVIPPPHPPVSAFPMGSATVLIGGKPALRVGDACVCGAAAAVGEPTVIIG